MLDSNSLEQVKQYNNTLKQYRTKSAQLNAEIEYINKEIDSLCAELTSELGIQVTKENIEQICKEQSDKIITTLQSGNAVLAKIASEEQNSTYVQNAQQTQSVVTQQVVQPAPVTPQSNVNMVQQTVPVTPVQQQVPVTTVSSSDLPKAVQGSVFNGQNNTLPNSSNGATLPPLFSLG